ncbi:MAG TPA: sulfite exporter TauE/SafE family protein [Gaiellaceae bacterium]|nr:sulfite exporter TauE/SafE family protein [Gaiellaceae bacterium]
MPRLVLIGLAAGVLSALFGVGGGIVIVPALVGLAGWRERPAAAASLGAIAVTALAGVAVYGALGRVDVGHAALVGLPAAVGAVAGTSLQQRVSSRAFAFAFAALLAVVAVTLLL